MKKSLYKLLLLEHLFQACVMGQPLRRGEITSTGDIDSVDCRILNLLQEDCRLSFNKVAARANVSVGTAYNRIKNLESRGLVKSYTVLVDSANLGLGLTSVIFVQAEGENLTSVEKKIAEGVNVVAVYDVTGEFDAAVIAKFKDRSSLNGFIKDLAAMPHVKRTITNVSLDTVKEDFRVKLP
jgi:Lrp/AsnC family transcriptional regulator, regulator for asnA, asnC and gidA